MVTAAFLLCAGGGAAAKKIDISQLEGIDVPEGLQQFLGAMVSEIQGLKSQNKVVLKEQNMTQQENIVVRAKLEQVTKDREALESKTNIMEAELRRENAALRIEVMELRNQTKTDLRGIHARLDQCEADSFAHVMERRHMQEQTPACGREAVNDMLAVCCRSGTPGRNGHRLQEFVGCDSLPPTCSLQCSYQFISIFSNCHDQTLMQGLTAEQLADWTSFYAVCSEVEQSAAEMGSLQPFNVRMFKILVSLEAAQSQAEIFGNVGQTLPSIGPLPELPPPPPASSSGPSATYLEQYHAQCTTTNILTCVPACNTTTHGYELLATIDGTDTKFSCNLAHGLYSWMGAASEGGFLGLDFAAFFSAVVSGAAGFYIVTLSEDARISTDVTIHPGQDVRINGDRSRVSKPSWGTGSIEISQLASLSLSYLMLPGAINAVPGAIQLSVTDCTLVGRDGQLHGHMQHGQANSPNFGTMYLHDVSATFTGTDFGGPGPGGNSHPDGRGFNSGGGRVIIVNCTNLGGHIQLNARYDTSGGSITIVGSSLLPADVHGDNGATIDVRSGGSVSLVSMAVPSAILSVAERILRGAGSTLRLSAVTVLETPDVGELTGTMTERADGSKTIYPPNWSLIGTPVFIVNSGPCTVSEGGRCVGRPQGYGKYEDCMISVGGGSGVLGPCAVFDFCSICGGQSCTNDRITLQPDDLMHGGSDCPTGAVLAPGDSVSWYSDSGDQGSVGHDTNGCATKGTCGLPYSANGLGGGWQICFA
jgi:hypothetical protein